jgi:hypothetical protein
MTLNVPISPETEARLRERAAASGEDLAAYAAGVLERCARPPLSIQEISGTIAEQFRQSGMSEDELSDLLDEAKHDARRQRRTS